MDFFQFIDAPDEMADSFLFFSLLEIDAEAEEWCTATDNSAYWLEPEH
jgi:hypothetical protein